MWDSSAGQSGRQWPNAHEAESRDFDQMNFRVLCAPPETNRLLLKTTIGISAFAYEVAVGSMKGPERNPWALGAAIGPRGGLG
jgi:hypothetical protein